MWDRGVTAREDDDDIAETQRHRPAFDQPEMLREALESVTAQDCDDFEVLVADDGSAVDLRPVLEGARTSLGGRLHVLRQENAGGAPARNLGLTQARAPWIAFLDHDDVWRGYLGSFVG